MVSLLVHALLGVVAFAVIVKSNPGIFSRFPTGSQVSPLEVFFYVVGLASIGLGYYFNYHFVQEYATPSSNPIWGPGSWQQFIVLGYDNPAASSASQDYTIMSLLIFPVWAIVDGRRRGIKNAWLYIAFILFFSSASAWAFYLAAVERQRRHQLAAVPINSPA
jgi:Terpene cyclase DEP1